MSLQPHFVETCLASCKHSKCDYGVTHRNLLPAWCFCFCFFLYFRRGVAPESGLTVVFHVLLVSNFKMKEGNLFIRAHGEDLGDFELNCVDMVVAE